MVWIPSKVSYYDDSVLDTYTPFITAYHGPSGHKGHSILKKDSSTTHRARSLDTSSDFDPTMGDYNSYRTTRTSYDDHDDDFVSSKNRNLHRLASDTLDDNDEIARRSRRHDQKLLNQITNKLHNWEVENQKPSLEVRELVGSSSRRNIDDSDRRRAALKNPVLRRATHEKRATAYYDDSDEVQERPRSLHQTQPAATLRQTYSPMRDASPYASPFKYSSLAEEFSSHRPYVRRYGLGATTTTTTELSSSPALKLGSDLIRHSTDYRPKPSYLDDEEEIDVENLFPKRRTFTYQGLASLSDDEDDEPYTPPAPAPTRTYNGTQSPGSYEYNYEDYKDDDSYLFEGDVHQRAGEISRRYKSGEGLYGQIDYHRRIYTDNDYSREYRREPDLDMDDDYVSPRMYTKSSDLGDDYVSPRKYTKSSDLGDDEYTPAHKYRPSVAALDSKLAKYDSSLPRSRLDQTEAWMEMQSQHRAAEDKESTSILDRIRVKDIYDAPLPHPRSHTGSSSSKKTSTHTNNKRSYRRLPAAPTATVVGTSAALPTYLDASRRRYTEVLGPDTEINRRVDALVDYDMPRALKSLSSVRDHMNEIKGGMGTHRMLIDRYLTLDLGPSQEVDYAVAQKYYELAARMPELEPDKYHRKALYADDSGVNLSSQRARSVGNIHHYGQFSQPVSETRNRLRKVITKARRDPTFYSY